MSFQRSNLRLNCSGPSHASYSVDGEQFITTTSHGVIRIWNDENDEEPKSLDVGKSITRHAVHGQYIFIATDSIVQAFTYPNIVHDKTIFRFDAPVTCMTANDKYLVACSGDGTIRVKPNDESEAIFDLNDEWPVSCAVSHVSLSVNGFLASCSDDTEIFIWNLAEKKCLVYFIPTAKNPTFEPKYGQLLAYSLDTAIAVVETENWVLKFRLIDSENNFSSCSIDIFSYSNCGKYLAASNGKGGICVWDIDAKKKLKQKDIFTEHEDQQLVSIGWSPKNNGEFVFTNINGQFGVIKILNEGNDEEKCYNNNDSIPVRTIFIPSVYDKPEEIQEYFETFGEVESVRVRVQDVDRGRSFALVQFRTARSAKAALSSYAPDVVPYWIRYSGVENPMKFEAAHFWHQPDHPLLVPAESCHILKLPDELLHDVLCLLNPVHLSIAGDVCKRFQSNANDAFKSKYKDFHHFHLFTRIESLESMLHKFGSLIETMKCPGFGRNKLDGSIVLDLISRYCTSSLRKLELTSLQIEDEAIHPLFTGLEELHLLRCTFSDRMKSLYGACKKLKVLKLVDCKLGTGECIKQNFPKLQTAEFQGNSHIQATAFVSFTEANQQLTKLKIGQSTDNRRELKHSSLVFQTIGRNLPLLIELDFNIDNDTYMSHGKNEFDEDVKLFSKFNSLKVLRICRIAGSMSKFMELLSTNQIPIEDLDLNSSEMVIDNDTIESISQMKQLKVLKISGSLTHEHLIQLTESLPHLHTLVCYFDTTVNIGQLKEIVSMGKNLAYLDMEIIDGIRINSKSYEELAATVKERPGGTKLTIYIKSNPVSELIVPVKIIEENSDWLEINFILTDN